MLLVKVSSASFWVSLLIKVCLSSFLVLLLDQRLFIAIFGAVVDQTQYQVHALAVASIQGKNMYERMNACMTKKSSASLGCVSDVRENVRTGILLSYTILRAMASGVNIITTRSGGKILTMK